MLEFKIPEISDKEWIDECLSNAHSMNCEYTLRIFLSAAGAGINILTRFLSAAVILKMPFCRL